MWTRDPSEDLEAAEIKRIFLEILEGGEFYDVDEIEAWLQNEGSWKSKQVRMRLVNISHYAQSRHEQANRFRMIPDGYATHAAAKARHPAALKVCL